MSQAPPNLCLWMLADPETPVLVGSLNRLTNGDVSLVYGEAWNQSGFPLSLDMPLGRQEHIPGGRTQRKTPLAAGAVDDARPDSWGEKVIRYLHKVRGNNLADFLYFAGDNRFGALGVSGADEEYRPSRSITPTLKDAPALSEIAKAISAGSQIEDQKRFLIHAGGSLGGAKPKAAIDVDGQPHILKLFHGEHVDQPLIEHATMTLASAAGIDVVKTTVVPLPGENAIAVARFDREGKNRLHCISASTVLRAQNPEDPPFGYPHFARALRQHGRSDVVGEHLRELYRRMVFNILIGNTDDHEKNHAVIIRDGRTMELSKAYDIVPTGSGITDHEFMIGEDSREALLETALGVCPQFGMNRKEATGIIETVIRVVNTWKDHFRQCGVTDADIEEIAAIVDRDDLLGQRREFDPQKAVIHSSSRPRRNPFVE